MIEQCILCRQTTTQKSSRHIRLVPKIGTPVSGYVCARCAWILGIGWRRKVRTGLHICTGIGLGLWMGQTLMLLFEWYTKRYG